MPDHESDLTHTITKREDPLVHFLHKIIVFCVKVLAIMMIIVILASLLDVGYIVYDKIILTYPSGVLHVESIITVLGAFIGVLIAIEIFNNITVYLKSDSLQAKLVLSTALIAISRKVIILDYKNTPSETIYALAAIVLATAIAYWVVSFKNKAPDITKQP